MSVANESRMAGKSPSPWTRSIAPTTSRRSSFAIPGPIRSARAIVTPLGLLLRIRARSSKHHHLRRKRRLRLHRVHRAAADGVAEVGKVGAGGTRRVDADQFGGPGGEEAVLA